MVEVVFVAPFFLPATLRMVETVAGLPEVRCSVVSQDDPARLPDAIRRRLADVERVRDVLEPGPLGDGVRELARRRGRIDRLFGALEHMQEQIAEVRDAFGIEGLPLATVRNFRDKARMKDVFRAHGIPCARHRLVSTADDAVEQALDVGFPLVVKPPAGAGARATYQIRDLETLRDLLATSPPAPGRELLLEEFVQGREHTLDTVSIDGKPVWHSISRYLPSPLEALRKPWVQWCIVLPREIDHPHFDPAREAGFAALDALGMTTGLSHMEFFERPDGSIAISEVAARPPGAQLSSIIGQAHGFELFEVWARLMVFGTFEVPQRRFAAGVAFLRGMGSGRVLGVRGLRDVLDDLGPMVVETKIPRPGQPHNSHYEGDGYVVVRHPETEKVEKALGRIITGIRVLVG